MDEQRTSNPLLPRLVKALHIAMKHYRHDDECGSSYVASDGSRGCGCGKTQDRFLIDALFSDEEWKGIHAGRVPEPPTADRICDDELKITYEHGQPYGIRDRGGYLFFFSKISKYSGQEERYRDEVAQAYKLADFLLRSLQRVAVTKPEFRDISEIVAEHEKDPTRKDALDRARERISDETSACSECKNPLQPGDPICVYCGAEQP